MKHKVTVQQIADAVGMSKYAVSRALSGKSGVSDETRALIIEAAQKMGYKLKHAVALQGDSTQATSTVSDETIQTILVLFPNISYQNKESVYWGAIFNGISNKLNTYKINILTLTEPHQASIFSLVNPEAIQGVIIVGGVSTPTLVDLRRLCIPMVIVDHLDRVILCDTLFADNYTAITSMMESLMSEGYSSYQFVGQTNAAYSFHERWVAFRNALEHAAIEQRQYEELICMETELRSSIAALFRRAPLPQVFVCANDVYARFTKEALDELGYIVNKDYVLTGFDYTYIDLPLYATVNVQKEALGERAVEQLIWRIKHPFEPFEKRLLHAQVIYKTN